MRRTQPALLLLATLLTVGACGPTDDDDDVGSGICADEDRAVPYEAGMVLDGEDGLLSVSLDDALPDPPDLGDNDWSLTVRGGDESGQAGCVLSTSPWMPDHGHGSSTEPVSDPTAADGTTTLNALDFHMAGFWTIAVEIECDDGTLDQVQFNFCIEG